jgi:hypothetical protein
MTTATKTCLALCACCLPACVRADDGDGWISLFDGRTLMGWQANDENPTSFAVEDGAIKVSGPRSHLFYVGPVNDGVFGDFEFKAKVKTLPQANSGIYFHTRYQPSGWPDAGYESQVNNSHGDWRKTGGLYAVQDVTDPPCQDNEWFDYYIKVYGKHVVIKINDQQVVDYTQPEDPEHTASMPGRRLGRGTFALQAHDPGSTVYFKDIYVRPLK